MSLSAGDFGKFCLSDIGPNAFSLSLAASSLEYGQNAGGGRAIWQPGSNQERRPLSAFSSASSSVTREVFIAQEATFLQCLTCLCLSLPHLIPFSRPCHLHMLSSWATSFVFQVSFSQFTSSPRVQVLSVAA